MIPTANAAAVLTAVVVGLVALVILAMQRNAGLASPLTLVAAVLALAYAVRPLVLTMDRDTGTLAALLDPGELAQPGLHVCLFVLALAAGVWIHKRQSPMLLRESRDRVVFPVGSSLVALALSLGAFMLAVHGAGLSPQSAFRNPVEFRAAANEGGLFYFSGVAVAASWIPFWLALIFAEGKSKRRLLVICALVGLVMTYPFGQRSYVIAPILGGLAWRELRRGSLRLAVILPLVASMAVAFGAYSTFRANSGSQSPDAQNYSVAGSVQDFSARFDTFDFFAQTQQWWGDRTHLKGRTLLDLLAQPIPRSVMPQKPSQTSAYLIGLQQPSEGRRFTPEYGYITELYINGGTALVALGGFMGGILIAAFDRSTAAVARARRQAFLLLPFLSYPAFWLLGGINSFTTVSFALFMTIQYMFALAVIRGEK